MAKFTITPEAKQAYNNGKSVQVWRDGKIIATISKVELEKFFNVPSVPASALRQGYPNCTIVAVK